MYVRKLLTIATLGLSFGFPVPRANADKMYWTEIDRIRRANLDGSNVEDLITALPRPVSIALDLVAQKMYWSEDASEVADFLKRANLDGSNIEVIGIASAIADIAIDPEGGKVYWTASFSFIEEGEIRRANLDGSNSETVLDTFTEIPIGISLDLAQGKIYWTLLGAPDRIQRSNLDGSNIEDLVTAGLDKPRGIALDLTAGKMYWTDFGTDKIQRANLDGSNIEDVVVGLDSPVRLAVYPSANKLYWTDVAMHTIQRAALDGSNVENLLTKNGAAPVGIALDATAIPTVSEWGLLSLALLLLVLGSLMIRRHSKRYGTLVVGCWIGLGVFALSPGAAIESESYVVPSLTGL